MKNNFPGEIALSILIVILLVLFLNPFHILMPSMMQMTLLGILVVVFVAFGIFVWKENIHDEREGLHRLIASRIGFLTGSAILLIGIIVQSFSLYTDPWLVFSLGAMVVGKLVAILYAKSKF